MLSDTDLIKIQESFEEFLDNFQNPETILNELDEEIELLKFEIEKRLNKDNVNENDLNSICVKLTSERDQLLNYQNDLNYYFDCNELNEIKKYQNLCNEKGSSIDQIILLNQFFSSIIEIDDLFKNSQNLLSKSEYFESRQCIQNACNLYEKMNNDGKNLFPSLSTESRLKKDLNVVLKKINTQITFFKEEFLYNLIQLFRKNVSFKNEDNNEWKKIFCFDFLHSISKQQYESYIQCILKEKCDFAIYFENILNIFNEYFIKEILINGKIVQLLADDESNIQTIQLIDSDSTKDPLDSLEHFVKIILNLFTLNNSIEHYSELISFIGELWSEQIFTCIINYYIEKSMPKSESEFDVFLNFLKKINNFEIELQTIGLMSQESNLLKEYSLNLQNHFSTKLCQDFIVKIKKILKQPQKNFCSEQVLSEFPLEQKSKFAICQISDYMVEAKDLFIVSAFSN